MVTAMSDAWAAARDAGVFTRPAATFASEQADRLARITEYLRGGAVDDARLEAERFETAVAQAPTDGPRGRIVISDAAFKAAMLADAAALRAALG